MKRLLLALMATAAAGTAVTAQTTVMVDPANAWIGYMNVFDTDLDGGGYQFGSSWGVADLNATFGGGMLTLTPNTSIARDNPVTDFYWFDETTQLGNKKMAATTYVEDSGLLGQTVNFEYEVLSNTLDGSTTESGSYTAVAFIKLLDAGYAVVDSVSAPLDVGMNTLTLVIPDTAGYHPQFGFELVGDNAPTVDANLGSVTIAAVPEPATFALLGGLAVLGVVLVRRRKLI